jgi:N-acetylneuraminic acid mutarotase
MNNKIYVHGGFNSSALSSLQVYTPATDSWASLASSSVTLHQHTLTAWSGKLYAIGGIRSGTTVSANNYRYDTSTNTWSNMTAMGTARCGAVAAVLGGKIHIMGGSTTNTGTATTTLHEVYDIANNTWSTAAALPSGLYDAAAVVLNGKIHVIGGAIAGVPSAIHTVYDTSSNTWTSAASLPAPVYVHGAGEAAGKIYVMGGTPTWGSSIHLTEIHQYDPSTDTWDTMHKHMTQPRWWFSPKYVNGKLYITAGNNGDDDIATTQEYTLPTTLYLVQKN